MEWILWIEGRTDFDRQFPSPSSSLSSIWALLGSVNIAKCMVSVPSRPSVWCDNCFDCRQFGLIRARIDFSWSVSLMRCDVIWHDMIWNDNFVILRVVIYTKGSNSSHCPYLQSALTISEETSKIHRNLSIRNVNVRRQFLYAFI
jgi:hypothetical protein